MEQSDPLFLLAGKLTVGALVVATLGVAIHVAAGA
jgi:hypothetical protein